jgi:uncharacterized protein
MSWHVGNWHIGISVGVLLTTIGVVSIAAFFQRISGFGFSLLSTPLLALVMPVNKAVVALALVSVPNMLLNWREFGPKADKKQVRWITAWAIPGMPLGIYLLTVLPDRALKVGVSLCVIGAAMLLTARIQIPAHRVRLVDGIVGFTSGVLNTSTGTNGPPLVFTFSGQDLEPDRTRGSLAYVFGMSNVVGIALFAAKGLITAETFALALAGMPAILVGRKLAAPIANRLTPQNFRRVAIATLVVTGIVGIIKALVS